MLLSCRLCQWLGFRQALEKSASATSFVSPFGRHKVTLLQAQLSTLAVGQRNETIQPKSLQTQVLLLRPPEPQRPSKLLKLFKTKNDGL